MATAAANGAIAHVHRVVTMAGAKETPRDEIEARTLRLAKELGLKTGKLEILHVDADHLRPGMRYAVDPKTRKLVGTAIKRQ